MLHQELKAAFLQGDESQASELFNEMLRIISRSNRKNLLDLVVSESQGPLYAEAAIDHSTLFRWDFA